MKTLEQQMLCGGEVNSGNVFLVPNSAIMAVCSQWRTPDSGHGVCKRLLEAEFAINVVCSCCDKWVTLRAHCQWGAFSRLN